jgi:Galactose-binding domain-like
MNTRSRYSILAAVFVLTISTAISADELNPQTHFYVNGNLIGSRIIQVGDPTNWTTNIENFSGQSASGKISISRDSYQSESDAIHISWSKAKQKGQFAIYGPEFDLSAYEEEGALVLEVKIDVMARGPIMMGMDCQWPCRSERDVSGMFRKYPHNQWFTFAVPINCFTLNKNAENFDLSKINGPLLLSADGKMEMSIANVRLGLLPVGDPGCKAQ